MPRRFAAARLVLLALVVAGALVATAVAAPSLARVHRLVDAMGWLAPAGFVLAYAALTVALVPGTASTLLAGAIFGPVRGAALALAGATLGATCAFLLGRMLGRDGVRRLLGRRAPRVEAALDGTGFMAMLVLRLLPVVPFNGLNYVAGITGIRLRSYVAATLVGIAPGTIAVAVAGSSVAHPTSPAFLASAAAGLAILLVSLALHARARRR